MEFIMNSTTSVTPQRFWRSIAIYHDRPHLINRKIGTIQQIQFCKVNTDIFILQKIINQISIGQELNKIEYLEDISVHFMQNFIKSHDENVKLTEVSTRILEEEDSVGVYISVRILYSHSKHFAKCLEFILLDKKNNRIRCITLSPNDDKPPVLPPFPFDIELNPARNVRIVIDSIECRSGSSQWLIVKLFSKLVKWMENFDEAKLQGTVGSLSLIKANDYSTIYLRLKKKYGSQLIEKWHQKTLTDPQKYIYEDIAIATYLICLWEKEKIIKFIDCGCGNGLLVYLLNQEGYEGCGIDIRSRSLWEIYPETTKLQVEKITPNLIFPKDQSNWIIGNHPDELTPWIPIIAARNNCNFFLLPCCAYNFNGHKFQRKNTSISTYLDYLQYIHDMCLKCGFRIDTDKLRIPSTRRNCLIGWNQLNGKSTEIIEKFVQEKLAEPITRYRTTVEQVRNCTKLDKSLIASIINGCVRKLLETKSFIQKSNGELWNQGGSLFLGDLANAVSRNDLKEMKREYGGLQTLLKNHRYIFDVTNGHVQLRLPINRKNNIKYMNKPCWFLHNHPNGCLYSNSGDCGFNHSK